MNLCFGAPTTQPPLGIWQNNGDTARLYFTLLLTCMYEHTWLVCVSEAVRKRERERESKGEQVRTHNHPMDTCMDEYIHTHIHNAHTHTSIYRLSFLTDKITCPHTYIRHSHTYVRARIWMHTCIHAYMHTCNACICTYAYVHAYTYTHTRTSPNRSVHIAGPL